MQWNKNISSSAYTIGETCMYHWMHQLYFRQSTHLPRGWEGASLPRSGPTSFLSARVARKLHCYKKDSIKSATSLHSVATKSDLSRVL